MAGMPALNRMPFTVTEQTVPIPTKPSGTTMSPACWPGAKRVRSRPIEYPFSKTRDMRGTARSASDRGRREVFTTTVPDSVDRSKLMA